MESWDAEVIVETRRAWRPRRVTIDRLMDPPLEKTPPKSVERIRAALESVHRDQPATEPGPYRAGFAPDEPIVIAAFHDRDCARAFQDALLEAGIVSKSRFHRTGAEVLVDHSDGQRASELLAKHLQRFPDRRRQGHRRDFDFAIFGSVLGLTCGAILLEFRRPGDFLALTIMTLFGTILGSLLDRPRNRYRRTGQLQFGLGDVLLLTAVIGLAIALWRLLEGR
jgi:hypothetical protein